VKSSNVASLGFPILGYASDKTRLLLGLTFITWCSVSGPALFLSRGVSGVQAAQSSGKASFEAHSDDIFLLTFNLGKDNRQGFQDFPLMSRTSCSPR
jgi:hypothetical protein